MGKKDVFHGWNCLLFYLELVWFIKLSMSKLEKNSNLVIILGLIPFFTIMEKFVTESNFMQFLKTMGNYFSEPILKLRIFWPISQIFIAFFLSKTMWFLENSQFWNLFKVNQTQNELMRSSFLPKYQPKINKIFALPSNILPVQKS